MHMAWWQDERPVWQIRCVFDVLCDSAGHAGALGCHRLEQAIAATGVVREPRVRLRGGQAHLVLLVRGENRPDASYRGLSAVDVAAAQVPGLEFGELRGLLARPACTGGDHSR